MAESERQTEKGKKPTGKPNKADEEHPIFHPSQAEGDRGTGQPPEEGAPDADEDTHVRPRPSQAEGDRES